MIEIGEHDVWHSDIKVLSRSRYSTETKKGNKAIKWVLEIYYYDQRIAQFDTIREEYTSGAQRDMRAQHIREQCMFWAAINKS